MGKLMLQLWFIALFQEWPRRETENSRTALWYFGAESATQQFVVQPSDRG